MEHSDFVVAVHKIPPEGLELRREVDDPRKAGIDLSVPLESPIDVDLVIERFGAKVSVRGEVRALARPSCARCLAEFPFPAGGEVEVSFAPAPADDDAEDRELAADDLDVQPMRGGAVDLRGVIAEQIHLSLPIKPLCREECRGLCPRCGRNLNLEPCACPGAAEARRGGPSDKRITRG